MVYEKNRSNSFIELFENSIRFIVGSVLEKVLVFFEKRCESNVKFIKLNFIAYVDVRSETSC